MTSAIRLAIAAAVVMVSSMFGAPAGYAFGDAPWCAVISLGKDDVYWIANFARLRNAYRT